MSLPMCTASDTGPKVAQAPLPLQSLSIHPSRLTGEVTISGAKNSVLRLMAASLLTAERVTIENYPAGILDGLVQLEMLRLLGKKCSVAGSVLVIDETTPVSNRLVWSGRSIRNTLLLLGALVARTGAGAVPLPGGCAIGDRKYDLHELVLTKLGARVWTEDQMLCAEAPKGLTGADITLPIRSTGATENALLCASLAKGRTVIRNPHMRPEIIDLIKMLRRMGAAIDCRGQESISVSGSPELTGAHHRAISDNMEALTWLIAAIVSQGEIVIQEFPFQDLEIPLIYLRESGGEFYREDRSIIVRGGVCYPVEISTGPYPGINSDMQPLFAAFAACASGKSRIVDLRFPDRFDYCGEFEKLGVRTSMSNGGLSILGGNPIIGAQVVARDLRCGAGLMLLGLIGKGETIIEDAWQIERGYDHVTTKLRDLGAQITESRIKMPEA